MLKKAKADQYILTGVFLCLLIFLAFFGAYFHSLYRPIPCLREAGQPQQSKSGANQQGGSGKPNSSAALTLNTTQSYGDPAQNTAECYEKSAPDWIAIFTGMLVVVGTGQLILFLWQLGLIRDSLVFTKEAADAARAAAEALPKIEKAYVFAKVKLPRPIVPTHGGVPPCPVRVIFPNRGKTPALLKRICAYSIIQAPAPQTLRSGVATDERRYAPGMVIAADKSLIQEVTVSVNMRQWGAIERREETIFCVGLIEYDDILGNPRETGFCWHFVPRGILGNGVFEITPGTNLNHHH